MGTSTAGRRPDLIYSGWWLTELHGGSSTDIRIGPLRAESANELSALAERVYGRSYAAAPWIYDPDEVAGRLRSGELWSVVATARVGEIVGHMALWHRRDNKRICGSGMTIVAPEARGHRLSTALAIEIAGEMERRGYVGCVSYPVTLSTVTHRLTRAGGGVETGMLVAHLPAETTTHVARVPTRSRSSVLVMYQPLREAPKREVFAPQRHSAIMRQIYGRAGLGRRIVDAGHIAPTGLTILVTKFEEVRSLMSFVVARVGADVCDRISSEYGSTVIQQIDLRLDDVHTPWAGERLRNEGFAFAAVLPEYASGDVLRLQRCSASEADPEPTRLVFAEADQMKRYVEADLASVGRAR